MSEGDVWHKLSPMYRQQFDRSFLLLSTEARGGRRNQQEVCGNSEGKNKSVYWLPSLYGFLRLLKGTPGRMNNPLASKIILRQQLPETFMTGNGGSASASISICLRRYGSVTCMLLASTLHHQVQTRVLSWGESVKYYSNFMPPRRQTELFFCDFFCLPYLKRINWLGKEGGELPSPEPRKSVTIGDTWKTVSAFLHLKYAQD